MKSSWYLPMLYKCSMHIAYIPFCRTNIHFYDSKYIFFYSQYTVQCTYWYVWTKKHLHDIAIAMVRSESAFVATCFGEICFYIYRAKSLLLYQSNKCRASQEIKKNCLCLLPVPLLPFSVFSLKNIFLFHFYLSFKIHTYKLIHIEFQPFSTTLVLNLSVYAFLPSFSTDISQITQSFP